jgi:hypothetical protein
VSDPNVQDVCTCTVVPADVARGQDDFSMHVSFMRARLSIIMYINCCRHTCALHVVACFSVISGKIIHMVET